jgi:hypothetical protein
MNCLKLPRKERKNIKAAQQNHDVYITVFVSYQLFLKKVRKKMYSRTTLNIGKVGSKEKRKEKKSNT